jgi:nucleoside permease NupC
MPILQSLFGLLIIAGITWVLSEDRRAIPWRTVNAGLAPQLFLARDRNLLSAIGLDSVFRVSLSCPFRHLT